MTQSAWYLKNIKRKYKLQYTYNCKNYCRITEKGRMDKMFGIEGLDKKWASISKKKVKKADNISQRRLGIKEDIEYI